MLQLNIGRRVGHQQSVPVSYGQPTDDTAARDGCVDDWDEFGQLWLEDTARDTM